MKTRPFFFWSTTTTTENTTSRSSCSSKSGSSNSQSVVSTSLIGKSRVSSFSSSRSPLAIVSTIITLLQLLALCTTVAHSFHCLPTCSKALKRSSIRQASSLLATVPQRPRGRYIPTTGLTFSVSSSATPSTVTPSFCRVRGGAASSSSTSSTTVLHQLFSSSTTTTTEEEAKNIIMAKIPTASSMTPAAKLEALRARMKELNLDVYLVPSDDPHLSGMYEKYYVFLFF